VSGDMKAVNSQAETSTLLPPSLSLPQVKICGLKRVDEALVCAGLGANAIGCVFYPRSPRHVTDEEARDICKNLPHGVSGVGVLVNESFATIMGKVERCGLKAVQLHGHESPDLVERLVREGVTVIKALFVNGAPALADAQSYRPSAFLVECAGGPLPGGNAMAWDWSAASGLSEKHPVILAGGLNPGNVADALRAASPDAVDVSSGVEASPGRKDLDKVKFFLEAVFRTGCARETRSVF